MSSHTIFCLDETWIIKRLSEQSSKKIMGQPLCSTLVYAVRERNLADFLIKMVPYASANREGNGTPLQYSCLENPLDGGAWWAAVHGVAKSRTWLSNFTFLLQGIKVKNESEVAQSCPTLSNPMDCSPPGSSIHGIFQARVLEWGAIALKST